MLDLPVFLFAGQSNMLGTRANDPAAERFRDGHDDILAFDGEAWRPLALGVLQKDGHGPEMSFARRAAASRGSPVGVIKLAKDGASLACDWLPRSRESGMYETLRRRVACAADQRPLRVVGFLWAQGAGDARQQAHADAYRDSLDALIRRVRADFGADVPVVLARTQQTRGTRLEARFPYMNVIRAAQEAVGNGPNCAWFSVDDTKVFTCGPDGSHFDSNGMVRLGLTFAEHVLRLAGEAGGVTNREMEQT